MDLPRHRSISRAHQLASHHLYNHKWHLRCWWDTNRNNVHQNGSILATKRTPIAFSVKTPKGAILIWYSRVLSILHRDVVSLNQCNYFGLITECQVPAHEAQVTKSASQTGANDEIVGIQMLITFCSYCLICRLSLITLSLYSVVGLEFYLKFVAENFLFFSFHTNAGVLYIIIPHTSKRE